jgi:hypothetical protein
MAEDVRTIQTEIPYVMPVAIAFTNTAGELITNYTEPPLSVGKKGGTVEILGMMTDIEGATGQFTQNGDGIWSDDQAPLAMDFGKPGTIKPVVWLDRPLAVSSGQRIRCDIINVEGEGPGTLYFIARQKRDAPRVTIPKDVGAPDKLVLDSAFTNTADERPARASTATLEEDFIVYGLHTNLNNATVRLFGVDGVPWSEDAVDVWAIAGREADAQRVLRLHEPYYIPARHKISGEFVNGSAGNVDAAGQIYLKGLRFPSNRNGESQ